jgi:RNA polymerase sigma factor (sigma-70 family)
MTKAVTSPILQLIRRAVEDQCVRDISDHELLQRFRDQRDEAAFHTLLRRHGPMVLDVCRGALGNETDAEDAFQATFLILVRKAASIRKTASVGSWLHGVAYRTALKARQQSATRQKNEARVPVRQVADPDDLTWREVRQVVHEELTGLPERYRVPLVMCYLEGTTQDKAAVQLGLANSTLKERLERGRVLLRARLVRRGLGPAAVVLAAAWPSAKASACLSLTLVTSTIRAAVLSAAGQATSGVISANVAALTEGVMKSMLLTKLKASAVMLLVAIVIVAGAVGMGFPALAAYGQPQKKERKDERDKPPGVKTAETPNKPSPPEEPQEELKVSGRVLGPDGKPVAGAKLYLGYTGPKDMTYPVRATTWDDGRFKFVVEKSELDVVDIDHPTIQVMAVAEGHGCEWVPVGPAGEEVTLRLVKDVPIGMRILDPDGKPVAGAKLTVMGLWTPKGGDLGAYLDAGSKGEGYAIAKSWDWPLAGQPAVLTTGKDGRFRLAGAGGERVVHLRVEGPGIASSGLYVMTRATESVKHPKGWTHTYGASSDYVAHASRPIRGVVRDKETGKPLAGVSVEHYHGQGPSALTDKEGRYELLGLAKGRQYSLVVKPPDGLYFRLPVRLQDTPGLGPLTCDIELTRGSMVRGRVTDKATGKPIAKARVEYHPLAGNTYASQLTDVCKPCAEATTGPDGSYELTVLPGQGVIGVAAPRLGAYMPALVAPKELKDFFKAPLIEEQGEVHLTVAGGANSFGAISQNSYNALVLLEPDEKEEGLVKDVALEPPVERKGRVVGPDDQPLTGVTVCGLTRHGVETLQGAEFTLRGINPRANRPLVFYHKDKNLGFYVKELRGVPSAPLTIKLQPCGSTSGRIIDPDGQPVAGLRLTVQGCALPIFGVAGGGSQLVTTDKEGRFRAEGLVPGQEYRVSEAQFTNGILRIYAPVRVEPGKHQELGDIKMDPEHE